ncbi:MAG: SMC family ATPase, partial [Methylacidiphilales bacterium]|nr:SMC family ATPase [Candidatus Methylacidiphilales bacterium]
MRPMRLTLQAFGPFGGREVVDFRMALTAGLFGIYGQTGAGKSSIFSAMTFALFGEAARAEQETPSLRSDHADPDLPTEVEFVFELGMRRYVVRRRPEQTRPKQRGSGDTRDIHEAWLFDATGLAVEEISRERSGKAMAERKVGLVREALIELLGYGPEQFRQIVLLPQGRFEAFLAAGTDARRVILRELFDVSLYRRIMEKFKADAAETEKRIRQEREVCARRLAAEGFGDGDALTAGIAAAEAAHAADSSAEAVAQQGG